MNYRQTLTKFLGALALVAGLTGVNSLAATFTVTSTNNTGAGTLRQAIADLNGTAGSHSVVFALPGSGPYVINLSSSLPDINNPATIDATTQPGFAGSPIIQLNGQNQVDNAFKLMAGNSTVRGFVIHQFKKEAIVIDKKGTNVIQGNYIGLSLAGTNALANVGGIIVKSGADSTVIGGTSVAERNLISGNAGQGINVDGAKNIIIQGNFIGVDVSGTKALPNTDVGVYVKNSANSIIGGATPGAGNVIAGNALQGIRSDGGNNHSLIIQGNAIGTDPGGTLSLGNGAEGILITGGDNNQLVGGTTPDTSNLIAFNGGAGISISSSQVRILGNSIFSNAQKGIVNGRTYYPIVTAATNVFNSTQISGTLQATANTTYRIEFFSVPTADSSGYGEGKTFLGFASVTTTGTGAASFSVPFTTGDLSGQFVAATATGTDGNTSEFSLARAVSFPAPLVITNQPQSQSVVINSPVTFTVEAGGAGPLSYQWFYEGFPLYGETSATFTIPAAQFFDIGNYSVTVTNPFGFVTSTDAYLDVHWPALPIVTDSPTDQSVTVGGNVVFSVSYSGMGPFKFQWRLNGVDLVGATNAVLILNSVQVTNSGTYSVVVSNPEGAVESDGALLTVQAPTLPFLDVFGLLNTLTTTSGIGRAGNLLATIDLGEPLIGGKPGNRSIWINWLALQNGIVTFSTAGSTFDTMLGVYTGTVLTGLTPVASDDDSGGFHTSRVQFNATLGQLYTIQIAGLGDGRGSVVMSWNLEATSATLPVIVSHPTDRTLTLGTNTTFAVNATGSGLTYQWYFNGNPIPGATTSSFAIPSVTETNVGRYFARVTKSGRMVETRPAHLELSLIDTNTPLVRSGNKFFDAALTPLTP
jgi:hypothetical protein